jgi:hypothetical protein
MAAEMRQFTTNVILDGDGKLSTLLTAPFTFTNQKMASGYYKVPPPVGAGYQKVDLNPAQRAGLLTQLLSLTGNHNPIVPAPTNPPNRAAFVWRKLLCGELPAPPNVVPQVKSPAPGLTARARFTEHAKAACAVCHKIIDPIGFAFESYDWKGVYREVDQGVAIDPSGSVVLPSGKMITFKNAPEMLRGIAAGDDAGVCFARQFYRYGLGHRESMADARSLKEVMDAFAKSNNNIKDLLLAIPQTEAFLFRAATPGEGI